MRGLERNMKPFYYAIYVSETALEDEYGNETGEYEITYSKPVRLEAHISEARGEAVVEQFWINVPYDKIILVFDMDCPIDEASILWVDTMPTLKVDGSTDTPRDYIVKQVSESINVIAYAIQKV